MKKLFLLTFIFCFFAPLIQAQNILKGIIQDEFNKGVSSVTIRILTMDSAFVNGATTDDKGLFLFNNIEKGKYILAISCIGYINKYLNFEMVEKVQTDIITRCSILK